MLAIYVCIQAVEMLTRAGDRQEPNQLPLEILYEHINPFIRTCGFDFRLTARSYCAAISYILLLTKPSRETGLSASCFL